MTRTFTEDANAIVVQAYEHAIRLGFVPVPHISARRIKSQAMLEEFLAALREIDAAENVFSVGGDPAVPHGPLRGFALADRVGLFQRYGVERIDAGRGRPPGGPVEAWSALESTSAALRNCRPGRGPHPGRVRLTGARWLAEVRRRGVELPSASAPARPASRGCSGSPRLGVSTSATIAKKYGFSMSNLPSRRARTSSSASPDGLDPARHGEVKLHFYTFGGFKSTAEWIASFRQEF